MKIEVSVEDKNHKNHGILNDNLKFVSYDLFIKNDQKAGINILKTFIQTIICLIMTFICYAVFIYVLFNRYNLVFPALAVITTTAISVFFINEMKNAPSNVNNLEKYVDFIGNHFLKAVNIEGQGKIVTINDKDNDIAIIADEGSNFNVKINSLEGSRIKGFDSQKILDDLKSDKMITRTNRFKVGDTVKFTIDSHGPKFSLVNDKDTNSKKDI